MEKAKAILKESGKGYPVVIIPKRCTMLETNCDETDNVFIDLNIVFFDPSGDQTVVYSGFCNVKIIDDTDTDDNESSDQFDSDNVLGEVTLADCTDVSNDSLVIVDPKNTPFLNKDDGTLDVEESIYSVYETHEGYVRVKQHNMAITDNLNNFNDSVQSSAEVFEINMSGDEERSSATPQPLDPDFDELECGLFLSQLPEEIVCADENRMLEEMKYMNTPSQDNALKQLMSFEMPLSKPQRTIMYLGENDHYGTTVQKIAVNDPNMQCKKTSARNNGLFDETPSQKIYQCDKCNQIFNRLQAFKQHIVEVRHGTKPKTTPSTLSSTYMCSECGKVLKTLEKLEAHCSGHGDPEKECDKCHKVFASKATLRNHKKLHQKKHKCTVCKKSFLTPVSLETHVSKTHCYKCSACDYSSTKYLELVQHQKEHNYDRYSDITVEFEDWEVPSTEDLVVYEESQSREEVYEESQSREEENEESQSREEEYEESQSREEEYEESQSREEDAAIAKLLSDEIYISDSETIDKTDKMQNWASAPVVADAELMYEDISSEQDQDPDSVIAMAISSDIFQLPAEKIKKYRPKKFKKDCCVCTKRFDRVSDLKRHLIEHVIRSTLAMTPVNSNGTLTVVCAVCRAHAFTKIDRYKAHLREHAQLTLYKCVNCKKSFSDSSNFSKHKKVHGAAFYQCDLCQRKFQSKKTLTAHIEYHNENSPLPCSFCKRQFHLPSLLNRHIRHAHTKEMTCPKCKFCNKQFLTLKATWDHEWLVHNVRKMIIDCLICNAKFRKYSELKQHCKKIHDVKLPRASKLLRSGRDRGRIEYGGRG